jgi:hypothetical protein
MAKNLLFRILLTTVASNRHFGFNSNPLDLALTGKADVRLRRHTRSVLPAPRFKGVSEYWEEGLETGIDDPQSKSISTPHSLSNASIVHHHSMHPMKRMCSFMIATFGSQLLSQTLGCGEPEIAISCSVVRLAAFVPGAGLYLPSSLPFSPFPRWRTSNIEHEYSQPG